MIFSWILAGRSLGKGNKRFLGYTNTIIQYLNQSEQSKLKDWNTFLMVLSTRATKMSEVIEIKSSFEHLFSVFPFCVLCRPVVWFANAKLGSPAVKVLLKTGDEVLFQVSCEKW